MSNIWWSGKALQNKGLYTFGDFTLDVATGLLTHNGEQVKLAPKVYLSLVYLVKNAGRVVSKDELFSELWPETFVEDNALSYTISQLRKALAAYDEDTVFVETVPRRGFRFAADVADVFENAIEPVPETFIERRTIEEVWIEEIDEPENRNPSSALALGPANVRPRRIIVPLLVLFAIIATGFGSWRYLSARQRVSVSELRSIAVLPLGTFEEGDLDEPLRMRITDSLITKLGNLDSLSVRPTLSVASFDRRSMDPLAFGRRLEVDAILDGRIQSDGEKLRVTLQLVSIASGEQLWSEQFDGRTALLLDLQDVISARLIDTLGLPLSGPEKESFEKRPTLVAEAYEEYLRGRYFWNKRSKEGLQNAIGSFKKAIDLDPAYAEAYIGLADSYYLLVDYSYDTSHDNIELAKQNLSKALALSPEAAEAHATLGHIQGTIEWSWEAAEASLKKAVELAPNSPNVRHRLAMLFLKLRRFAEAENELIKARQLDPTSLGINMNLGVIYCFSGRNAEAIAQLQKTVDLDRHFIPVKWYMARCQLIGGNSAESLGAFHDVLQASGDEVSAAIIKKRINAAPPEQIFKELAKTWENRISPTTYNPHDIALIESFAGNVELAITWLERSANERHPWASWINCEPEFDGLKQNERFRTLLSKMNFPQSQ